MVRPLAYRFALLSAAAMAPLAPAHAQDAPEASEDSGDIIVTAQRRQERLQDVPMAITALSAETLTRSGIATTADLPRATPGLLMTSFTNQVQPSIRGVTATGGNSGDNPSVAVYVDGAYQAQPVAILMDLPDVASVQVLKGPQGTLYGQNATGGAIIVTTAAPSFTPTGRFSASYGNYDDVQLRGFVSGPVAESVAVSLTGAYQKRDGFRRSVLSGERDRGLDSKVVRGKVLLAPSDDLEVTLTGFYVNRFDSAPFATQSRDNGSVGFAIFPSLPRATGARQFTTNPDVFSRFKGWGTLGNAKLDTGAGTFNLNAAYAKSKVTGLFDLDASPVDLAVFDYRAVRTRTFTSELTFTSREFGILSFLAGASYLHGTDGYMPGPFIQYAGSLPPAAPVEVFSLITNSKVTKDVVAAYGEATLKLTDEFTLTGGLRYTHEHQTAVSVNNLSPLYPVRQPFFDGPQNWSKLTPRATARYEFAPDNSVYASYTQGFKGGLINTVTFSAEAVDPETITSYEVGYKGKLSPDFSLNFSAFRYDYKNLQVVIYVAPDYITQNAASARGKGFELDGSWNAAPGITFTGGVAYLDAKYRKFPGAQSFVRNPLGLGYDSVIEDLGGHRLLRAPKWSGNLSANYEAETRAGTFGSTLSLYATSKIFIDPNVLIEQDAYATLNGEVSFAPSAIEGLRFVLWGKNLFDTTYYAGGQVNNFSQFVTYGDPLTVGGRVEFKF